MKRLAAILLGSALLAAAIPAAAADSPVRLTLDGRPVDKIGGIAVLRDGTVFADVIDLTKSFDGLVTLGAGSATVSINGNTGSFAARSKRAVINKAVVMMPTASFMRNGDLYVPLNVFITRVAGAKVRTNPQMTRADILVNANPLG